MVTNEWMEQLKAKYEAMQAAGISMTTPPATHFEVTQADLARERRRLRMKGAGPLFPAAIDAAMASVGKCPRVASDAEWHGPLVDAAEAFVREPGTYSLVLSAPPGRGKSWIATWVVAETSVVSMWLPASECRVGAGWDALRSKATKASLLVLDDLGEESSGEWGVREMATLLEGRHNAGKRTVVTTNLVPQEIAARYGERLMSRWGQAPYSRLVMVRGADLRRGR